MTPHMHATPIVGRLPGNRHLTADEIEALVRARESGASVADIASAYNISRRTVYRWSRTTVVDVEAHGWRARFALRPEQDAMRRGPVQLEDWQEVVGP